MGDRTGRVLAELLTDSHLMSPVRLASALAERSRPFGVRQVRIYLVDLQKHRLRPLPGSDPEPASTLSVEGTLAGRAFQNVATHHAPLDGGLYRAWVPLLDGTDRLGVMEVVLDDVGPARLDWCRTLASLASLLVVSKRAYSDVYAEVQRSDRMSLQAEMVRTIMPPSTFVTEEVLVTAALEPAYEVGGDAFDYALFGDRLYVSVFDAVGHDLTAGLISSLAVAACRCSRRFGGDLATMVEGADRAIAGQFGGDRFATALLCALDISTGRFTWVPCGHPPPLLIRDNKVVKELVRRPFLPLGVVIEDAAVPVHAERLEPGDRILLYTDGVVEGRGADGGLFGLQRLGEFVTRHSATGLSAPETLRRLNHSIVDYQSGRLSDDATTVLIEWMPSPRERPVI